MLFRSGYSGRFGQIFCREFPYCARLDNSSLNALSHPVKIRIVLVSFRLQAVGSARSSALGGICNSCYVGIFHGCYKNGRCRWNISDIAYRAIGPPPVSFLKMLFRLHCWSNFLSAIIFAAASDKVVFRSKSEA